MHTIAVGSLRPWLNQLARQALVLAPAPEPTGDVALLPLSPSSLLNYARLDVFPKAMLASTDEPGRAGRDRPDSTGEQILFGLRPCDCAAIEILDAYYTRIAPDQSYQDKRRRMRLVVMACERSQDTCFCGSTGTGPVARSGFDVQLFPIGDALLAAAGTEDGKRMIADGEVLFSEAPADADARIDEFTRRSRDGQNIWLDLHWVQRTIRRHEHNADFWRDVTPQCLMCGGCTSFCPTCTCHDGFPPPGQQAAGQYVRQDCHLGSTGDPRQAGRLHQAGRCGRRFTHKLGGSDTPAYPFRCVGCGRCADACLSCAGIIVFADQLANYCQQRQSVI